MISVKRGDDGRKPFVSPHIMAIVTCTVVSRTRKLCRCLITHVGSVKLPQPIRGIIRREYITDVHRDAAEIETSFGIGDTVLARIVRISSHNLPILINYLDHNIWIRLQSEMETSLCLLLKTD